MEKVKLAGCPACKKRISLEAPVCPKCGQPLDDAWRQKASAEIIQAAKQAKTGCAVFVAILAGVVLVGLIIGPGGEGAEQVAAAEYGDDWGLSVPVLELQCKTHLYSNGIKRPHVLVHAGSTTYALNGAAKSSGLYQDADTIQTRDANGLFKRGPSLLVRRGVKLCE